MRSNSLGSRLYNCSSCVQQWRCCQLGNRRRNVGFEFEMGIVSCMSGAVANKRCIKVQFMKALFTFEFIEQGRVLSNLEIPFQFICRLYCKSFSYSPICPICPIYPLLQSINLGNQSRVPEIISRSPQCRGMRTFSRFSFWFLHLSTSRMLLRKHLAAPW